MLLIKSTYGAREGLEAQNFGRLSSMVDFKSIWSVQISRQEAVKSPLTFFSNIYFLEKFKNRE